METKRWWAVLQLLDRQLVDRDGRMVGNVDDLEVTVDDDGRAQVSAVLAGPGTLLPRLGFRRLGDWLRSAHASVAGEDLARIPVARVASIDDHVTVSLSHEDMATYSGERWVADHLIGPIPGSGHAPPE